MNRLLARKNLSDKQLGAIESPASGFLRIVGGPNTDKTQVLLHRIRYLVKTLKCGPDHFRIFAPNVLHLYFKSALRDLELTEETVVTPDEWCRLFYERRINKRPPWDNENQRPDFPAIRAAVTWLVTGCDFFLPLYDFIVVDEAQDLDAGLLATLARLARHGIACFERGIVIDDGMADTVKTFTQCNSPTHVLDLDMAFAPAPYLAKIAAIFSSGDSEGSDFDARTRFCQSSRETPLIYFARDIDDELRRLIEVLRERSLLNERVGVLLPHSSQVFGWSKRLRELGIDAEYPGQTGCPLNFHSSRPKSLSYQDAKGPKFDSVLLPRLTPTSFAMLAPRQIERLLSQAVGGATKWAYFSTSVIEVLPALNKLLPLECARELAIQRSGPSPVGTPRDTPEIIFDPPTSLEFL